VNPSDSPIMIMSLKSKQVPLPEIFDQANTIFAEKISQIQGVGQVFVGGGQQPAVRVQVDPVALSGVGLGLEDVRKAISSSTSNQPKGLLIGDTTAFTIDANSQIFRAAGFLKIILTYQNGAAVRLGDIADVFDDVENSRRPIQCPSCGAPLPASQETKFATCTFCHTVSRIPDRTWFQLSGKEPVREPMWLYFRGHSPLYEAEARRVRADAIAVVEAKARSAAAWAATQARQREEAAIARQAPSFVLGRWLGKHAILLVVLLVVVGAVSLAGALYLQYAR